MSAAGEAKDACASRAKPKAARVGAQWPDPAVLEGDERASPRD